MAAGRQIAPVPAGLSASARILLYGKIAVIDAAIGWIGRGLLIHKEKGIGRTRVMNVGKLVSWFEAVMDSGDGIAAGIFVNTHHAAQRKTPHASAAGIFNRDFIRRADIDAE